MKIKKLLKAKGIDPKVVDTCRGVQALRLLGIKRGVLAADDKGEAVSSDDEAAPVAATVVEETKPPPRKSKLSLDLKNAIYDDPNLRDRDITTMEELHTAMKELSDAMPEDPDGSYWKQLTFDGTHPYPIFKANRMKKDTGMDSSASIIHYYRYAIKDERDVKNAMEYLDDGRPSFIMEGLYHGGFKCQLKHDTLRELNVTCIVNTAMGCGTFAKNWEQHEAENREFALVLNLDWQDDPRQVIPVQQLTETLQAINVARESGGAAMVHCMQGRSRSATVVVAYVMAKNGMRYREALELVQHGRSQAQPNGGFEKQLRAFEKEGMFKALNNEWSL